MKSRRRIRRWLPILLRCSIYGRLTDGKGRVVDFTNTIIIANVEPRFDIIQRNLTNAVESDYKCQNRIQEVLRGHFRPEFHQPTDVDHRLSIQAN